MLISDWSSDVCSSDLSWQKGCGAVSKTIHCPISPRKSRHCELEKPDRLQVEIELAYIRRTSQVLLVARARRTEVRGQYNSSDQNQISTQIGRASCRERVCQYVKISVVAVQ